MGGQEHRFELSMDDLRGRRHPAIAAAVETGDRDSIRQAAFEIVRRWFDPGERDASQPLVLVQEDGAWIVPAGAVAYARFEDPTTGPTARPFGFLTQP
jgi:hypothetical protein